MKSVLLIGLGVFGTQVAEELNKLGHEVMAVDKDENRVNDAMPLVTDAQIGDSTSVAFLKELGVNNYDLCIVAIGNDFQSSLEITAMLKDLNAKWVVSKAKRDSQARFLINVGADEVIYPERETAERLAIRYNSDSIFDCIELTDEYSIYEISTPPEWVGKTIAGLNVRKAHKVDVIAIKKGETLNPMPGGDYVFQASDLLVVIGKSQDVFRLCRDLQ